MTQTKAASDQLMVTGVSCHDPDDLDHPCQDISGLEGPAVEVVIRVLGLLELLVESKVIILILSYTQLTALVRDSQVSTLGGARISVAADYLYSGMDPMTLLALITRRTLIASIVLTALVTLKTLLTITKNLMVLLFVQNTPTTLLNRNVYFHQ